MPRRGEDERTRATVLFSGGRRTIFVAVGVAVVLATAGCPAAKKRPPLDATPRGGTLRVVVPRDISGISAPLDPAFPPLDPQKPEAIASEIFRCCLLRTMLSHSGRTT